VLAAPEQALAQSEPAFEPAKESTPFTAMEEHQVEEAKLEEAKYREPKYDEPKQEEAHQQHEAQQEESNQEIVPEVEAVAAPVEELSTPALEDLESASPIAENEIPEEPISASPAATHANEAVGSTEPGAEGIKEVAKDAVNKESEIAETTAAAWASWRRIRESGDGKGSTRSEKHTGFQEEKGLSQDASARAVAAGAEKSPEDPASSSEESPEIANIVDSVLADMRPRIVEEISRKLGKKK
jgi:hypothetical protein